MYIISLSSKIIRLFNTNSYKNFIVSPNAHAKGLTIFYTSRNWYGNSLLFYTRTPKRVEYELNRLYSWVRVIVSMGLTWIMAYLSNCVSPEIAGSLNDFYFFIDAFCSLLEWDLDCSFLCPSKPKWRKIFKWRKPTSSSFWWFAEAFCKFSKNVSK